MLRFKLPVKVVRRHLAHPFPDRVGSLLFGIGSACQGIPSGNLEQAGMLMKGIPGDLWSFTMSFCLYLHSC